MRKLICGTSLVAALFATGSVLAADTAPAAPKAESNSDLLARTIDVEKIKHERALTLYRLAMENAEKALADGEWDKAIRYANDALFVVDENRGDLWGTEINQMRELAGKAVKAAEDRTKAAKILPQPDAKPATPTPAELAKIVAEADRNRQIRTLRETAKTLEEQHKYIEAADTLRQLLTILPEDTEAKAGLRMIQDKTSFRTFDHVAEQQSLEQTRQSLESRETLIPYADPVTYPSDWVEKTRSRP